MDGGREFLVALSDIIYGGADQLTLCNPRRVTTAWTRPESGLSSTKVKDPECTARTKYLGHLVR